MTTKPNKSLKLSKGRIHYVFLEIDVLFGSGNIDYNSTN